MEYSARIHLGLWMLVLGSLLGIISLIIRGPLPLPSTDVETWVQVVTDRNYFLAQVLTIFAYLIPFIGFWSIYASLEKIEKIEKLAFWGFMTSIIGTSLAIATFGVVSFVSPMLAERYLQGEDQLPEIISQVSTSQPAIINILGGTLYLFGTGLLGMAIWRSGTLPRWSGLLLALHGLFLVFGFMLFPMLVLSWVLLLSGGLWLFIEFQR